MTRSPIASPWAKTNRKKLDDPLFRWHSYLHHQVDVAVAFRVLARGATEARLAAALGVPVLTPATLDRLCVLALLHDAGKALSFFQDKISPGSRDPFAPHVSPMAWLVAPPKPGTWDSPIGRTIRAALGLDGICAWGADGLGVRGTMGDLLAAAFCHHGGMVAADAIQAGGSRMGRALDRTRFGHDPLETLRSLEDAARALFPLAWDADAPPIPASHELIHLFSGLLTVADWVASDRGRFPYANGRGSVRDRAALAQRAAERWVVESGFHEPLGLDPRAVGPQAVLGGRDPRPLQERMLTVPLDHRFVLVEDLTGSGKTEAALIRYVMLVQAGLVDGLYFAVPTRSAAADLHVRVDAAIRGNWTDAPPVIAAIPALDKPDTAKRDQHGEVASRPWVTENSKRFLAAGGAVGSVDQAMMSALNVKHSHMRAGMLSRSFLVVDEVHAADPYMSEVIGVLVRRHLTLGGHAMLMSATLGSSARAAIQDEDPPEALDDATPFPAISSGVDCLGPPKHVQAFRHRTVTVGMLDTRDMVDRIAAAARNGARVLVIRATVDDAVATLEALPPDVPTLVVNGHRTLHHGRFAGPDRKKLDAALLAALSGERCTGGIVCVATQTAEQSLDIDADLLVTDPCPADVLLQRLGRLHRHDREPDRSARRRPDGYGTPTALVIDPGDLTAFLAERPTADRPTRPLDGLGFSLVYQNLLAIQETLAWVRLHGKIDLVNDSRPMVERATHDRHLRGVAERLSTLDGRWTTLWQVLYGADRARAILGKGSCLDWRRRFREQPMLADEKIRTRLGADDVMVDLPREMLSPFGEKIVRLRIPAHWLPDGRVEDQAVSVGTGEDGATIITLGGLRLHYGRLGLLRDRPVPG